MDQHSSPDRQERPLDDYLDDIRPAAQAVFGERLGLAVDYHRLLATTGSERGFMGPREVPRLWERHLLNCAVLGEAIQQSQDVVDIGSGAGLPGIPLAIARPDLHISLVEPLLKRAVFLREVVNELQLDNVVVIRGRAEEAAVRRQVGGADIVSSRAVAPLGKLAGWSLPLVAPGGYMLAMKGASAAEEIQRDHREVTAAGGGKAEIISLGDALLTEPTTVVRIPRPR